MSNKHYQSRNLYLATRYKFYWVYVLRVASLTCIWLTKSKPFHWWISKINKIPKLAKYVMNSSYASNKMIKWMNYHNIWLHLVLAGFGNSLYITQCLSKSIKINVKIKIFYLECLKWSQKNIIFSDNYDVEIH